MDFEAVERRELHLYRIAYYTGGYTSDSDLSRFIGTSWKKSEQITHANRIYH